MMHHPNILVVNIRVCSHSMLHNLTFSFFIVHHGHLFMLRNIIVFCTNKQYLKCLEYFTDYSSIIYELIIHFCSMLNHPFLFILPKM